jgi:acyl carrier protein
MEKQISCPICGNLFVAEFYEPIGTALCLQCGATFRRLRDCLLTLGGVNPDQISLESCFIDDLNMDSLDVVELVMAMEEEGIELTDEEAREVKTIRDAIRIINQYRAG